MVGDGGARSTDVLPDAACTVGVPFSIPAVVRCAHGSGMFVTHRAEYVACSTQSSGAIAWLTIWAARAVVPLQFAP